MEAWICMTHFVLSRNTSSYHTNYFLTLALPGFLFSELDIFPQHGKMYTN